MLAHGLEALEDALADGHARHDDDELGDAIAAVQLVDGADVHVGLAGARLHLDGEVAQAPVGEDICRREAALLLHGMQVVEELAGRHAELVAVADGVEQFRLSAGKHAVTEEPTLVVERLIDHEATVGELLTPEQVAGSLYSLQLMLLVG